MGVVVTRAASGMGAATARALDERARSIVLVDLHDDDDVEEK